MEIEIIRDRRAFLTLRHDWDALLRESANGGFYLCFDWFHAVLFLHHDPPEDLRIICFRESGRMIAIVPCCIMRARLRLGSYRTLEIIGNIYSPLRGCIVMKSREKEVAERLSDLLVRECSNDWDILNFEDLSMEHAPISALVEAAGRKGLRRTIREQYPNLSIDFSALANSGEFWKTKGRAFRHSIRNSLNKMNRSGRFEMILIRDNTQDVHTAMQHYYEVYGHSWKMPEEDPEFHRNLARYFSEKGWLRLFILYHQPADSMDGSNGSDRCFPSLESSIRTGASIPIGYAPVAADFLILFDGCAYFLKTAYREDHASYSPGKLLHWFAAKYLLDEDKASAIDFGEGGEEYKYQWGEINRIHSRLRIANPACFKALFELWCEENLIPPLRDIKRRIEKTQCIHPSA